MIRVFPACPKTWDAAFTLAARGGFLVTSSQRTGKVEFVELKSRAGSPCRIRNPWPDTTVSLYRNGSEISGLDLTGELLQFATKKDETIVLMSAGGSLSTVGRLWLRQ